MTKRGHQIDLVSAEWRLAALNMDPDQTGQGLPVTVYRVSLSECAHAGGWRWLKEGGGAGRIFDMTPRRVPLKGERLCLFRN